MMRGFAIIALDNPKFEVNLGGALRAAQCYGAHMVVYSGKRLRPGPANPAMGHRHLPLIHFDGPFIIPYDCVPVAVDLLPDATPLPRYTHPERAFYVFGAEDATLGRRVTDYCRDRVMVPTRLCMNLAATVNVVLYDRMVKRGGWE